jgi:acetyltransferase-like isoleucine patch superfamily enzyme/predicted RNA methylase
MKFIHNLKKKIKKKLATILISEFEKIQKERSQSVFNSIENKGQDSFYWGKDIFISDPKKIQLGANVHIGNNAYLKTEGGLKIGDNTHISRNLVLYTVNHNFKADVLPYNDEMIYKEVVIGKNVWIGMNVCITPGTTIGDGSIIGMGSVVSGIIPELSIVGTDKLRVLGKRDSQLYTEIVDKGRFGKENGLLYTNNNQDKVLVNFGDKIIKSRSSVELTKFNEKHALKKIFENSIEGMKSFENEKNKYLQFQKYSWIPQIYEIGDNFIVTEFLNNDFRLDKYIKTISDINTRNILLGKILLVLIDIYGNKIAHCDFHSKNIFVTPEGIKIIDFETSQEIESNPDFFESYDITGEGLKSPFLTDKMCVLSSNIYSLKSIFKIKDLKDLKSKFNDFLIDELYIISGTFFTRKNDSDKRHSLQNKYIYSTFDLKHLSVDKKSGQRNIKKRIQEFGIHLNDIKNKNVLDIGSNIGGILCEITKMKPKSALGLEYDNEKVIISNRISRLNNLDSQLNFIQKDVESDDFIQNFKKEYEVVFCLAVIEHLKNKERFIDKLGEICTGILYFEGNSGTNKEFIINELKRVGFNDVHFIGNSKDEINKNNNVRPLFIAKK